ncbi:MAG TPA: adenylosuccinate lyase [Chthoniobacterales bacterium]
MHAEAALCFVQNAFASGLGFYLRRVIERYSRAEMRELWSENRKFQIWLEIETLACEAMAELGQIPKEDAVAIRERARFSIAEIAEIEKRTNHDVIAFLENVAVSVGPAARWIHQGLTSSDILDTTLAVQLTEACRILAAGLKSAREAIAEQARRYKMTPMIGRSHGIHAEPITFGLKLALMYDEFGRAEERLAQTRERIRVGKLSGAVGTHAHLDPRIERSVCERLGLKAATLSTQIIQRDRHAEFSTTLALIASSIDRWATEFRHLQRTEVLEVEEFFGEGQKGSSAMPHKRNPITGERLSGLARVLRGHAVTALENVALWHERDISHSSAERIILPDGCILLDYMLAKLRELVAGLQVYPEHMQANLERTKGLYCSQSILLALTRAGAERKTAYEAVQRAAMRTWKGGESFAENAKAEPEITALVPPAEIDALCSLEAHFRYVQETFEALGLEGRASGRP